MKRFFILQTISQLYPVKEIRMSLPLFVLAILLFEIVCLIIICLRKISWTLWSNSFVFYSIWLSKLLGEILFRIFSLPVIQSGDWRGMGKIVTWSDWLEFVFRINIYFFRKSRLWDNILAKLFWGSKNDMPYTMKGHILPLNQSHLRLRVNSLVLDPMKEIGPVM